MIATTAPVKLSLVLDMDGTLISHIARGPTTEEYLPVARPYLFWFLCACFENFLCVSIWTAAEPRWYYRVSDMVLQPILLEVSKYLGKPCSFSFVWSRKACRVIVPGYTPNSPPVHMTKPLDRIWAKDRRPYCYYTADNTIIVDDNEQTFVENLENAIHIPKFNTFSHLARPDTCLWQLGRHFEKLHNEYKASGTIHNAVKINWH